MGGYVGPHWGSEVAQIMSSAFEQRKRQDFTEEEATKRREHEKEVQAATQEQATRAMAFQAMMQIAQTHPERLATPEGKVLVATIGKWFGESLGVESEEDTNALLGAQLLAGAQSGEQKIAQETAGLFAQPGGMTAGDEARFEIGTRGSLSPGARVSRAREEVFGKKGATQIAAGAAPTPMQERDERFRLGLDQAGALGLDKAMDFIAGRTVPGKTEAQRITEEGGRAKIDLTRAQTEGVKTDTELAPYKKALIKAQVFTEEERPEYIKAMAERLRAEAVASAAMIDAMPDKARAEAFDELQTLASVAALEKPGTPAREELINQILVHAEAMGLNLPTTFEAREKKLSRLQAWWSSVKNMAPKPDREYVRILKLVETLVEQERAGVDSATAMFGDSALDEPFPPITPPPILED